MNLEGFVYVKDIKSLKLSLMDRWILSRLSTAISIVDEKMEKYSFGEGVNQIYSFWLDNFCDVYLEYMKPVMKSKDDEAKKAVQNVLYYCMDRGLRLMHPFMPFLTEELYQRLPHHESNRWESICIAEYPTEVFWMDSDIEAKVTKLLEISKSILSVLSQFKIDKSKPRTCIHSDQNTVELVAQEKLTIQTLAKTGEIFATSTQNDPNYCKWLKNIVNASTDVLLDIKDLIDINKEIERLQKIIKEKAEYKADLLSKMNSPQYEERVKDDIKKVNSKKLSDVTLELEKLEESMKILANINN
jgi:valyl-tRNA synthetase